MQPRTSFDSLPEEIKDRLNKYTSVYQKFLEFLQSREADNLGRHNLRSLPDGRMTTQDEMWMRAVSTEFRKLIASDEPINYFKIKQLLFHEAMLRGTSEELVKKSEILKALAGYEKKFWNKASSLQYGTLPLASENIIRITHNQYFLHSGGTKAKNSRSNKSSINTIIESSFIKSFPDSNPLIGTYLTALVDRQLCLALLNECILSFKEDRFVELVLPQNLVPNHGHELYVSQDFILNNIHLLRPIAIIKFITQSQ